MKPNVIMWLGQSSNVDQTHAGILLTLVLLDTTFVDFKALNLSFPQSTFELRYKVVDDNLLFLIAFPSNWNFSNSNKKLTVGEDGTVNLM